MKKVIFALVALFCVTAVSAQRARTSNYSSSEKKDHFAIGVGAGVVGSGSSACVNMDLRWQKDINKNFALDLITVDWAAPFDSPADYDELSLRVGARGFTNPFYKNMRAYVNLGLGYTCVLVKGYGFSGSDYGDLDIDDFDIDDYLGYFGYAPQSRASSSSDGMNANHAFGLEFGTGIELTKKIAVGYSLRYNTFTKTTGHFGKVSFRF